MVHCLKCGKNNKDRAKHCIWCGASLTRERVRCQRCGTSNPADARFCEDCGKSLAAIRRDAPLQTKKVELPKAPKIEEDDDEELGEALEVVEDQGPKSSNGISAWFILLLIVVIALVILFILSPNLFLRFLRTVKPA